MDETEKRVNSLDGQGDPFWNPDSTYYNRENFKLKIKKNKKKRGLDNVKM